MRRLVFRVWPTVTMLSTLLMIMAFQNCGQPGTSSQASTQATEVTTGAVTMTGTVQQSQVDGCRFLISVQDENGNGKNYIPLDMDSRLLVAGNTVAISGTVRDDIVSTCMAGPILQVDQAAIVK
jgi:hypothetical protein